MFRAVSIVLAGMTVTSALAQTAPLPPRPARPAAATRSADLLPAPTRVMLRLDRVPAKEAFNQLFAAAGLKKTLERHVEYDLEDNTISVDLVDAPFLVALKELCRQCRHEPADALVQGRRITLRRVGPGRPSTRPTTTRAVAATTTAATQRAARPSWVDAPHLLSGPFMIVPKDATRTSVISLDVPPTAKGRTRRSMQLSFVVLVDPNIRLTALTRAIAITTLQDDRGRAMMAPDALKARLIRRDDPPPPVGAREWIWEFTMPLDYATADANRIGLLRGTMRASIRAASDRLELTADDFRNEIRNRKVGGVRMTFGKLVSKPRGASRGSHVPLVIYRDGRSEAGWRELMSVINDMDAMEAYDERGERMAVTFGLGSGKDDQTQEGWIEFSPFDRPGNEQAPTVPAKVVWTLATDVDDVVIPVKLKDLELP